MKTLSIVWQRLVGAAGTTCPRSQDTHKEGQRAVERLKRAVEPLGITPVLKIREFDQDCRTIEVRRKTYEVIPEELLVRAGLIAASRLLDPTLTS